MSYIVNCILETRGNRRNKKGNKLFKILWSDNTTTWESLYNLIDSHTYLEDVQPILLHYAIIAKNKPNMRRYCLCCKSKTVVGTLFCESEHCSVMKELVENIIE
jgi:hypothetical protein